MLRRSYFGFVLALLLLISQLQGCGRGSNPSTAPSPITISADLPVTGTIGAGYVGTLTASGGAAPYFWSVTGFPTGFSITGTSTPTVVVTGTPTALATYSVTATVTDTANQTAQSTVSVVIANSNSPVAACPSRGNENALSVASPFAFLVKGFTSDSPIVIGGSFTPSGDGSLKAGSVDYTAFYAPNKGHVRMAVNSATSSYSLDSVGRGCLSLAVTPVPDAVQSEGSAVRGVQFSNKAASSLRAAAEATPTPTNIVFSFVLGEKTEAGYQSGRIIEFDHTATSGFVTSGMMHVQTPADFALASFQSNYAFGVDGWDTLKGRETFAGTFINNSGTLSGAVGDFNDEGSPQLISGEMDEGTGSLGETIESSTGRGTGTIDFPDVYFSFAFYVINRSDFYIVSTDPPTDAIDGFAGLLSGQALATKASFTPGSLAGSYLLTGLGFDSANVAGNDDGNVAEIGNIQASATGDVIGGNLYTNHTGGFASTSISAGSYLTQTSGRTTISAPGAGAPVVYLTAPSSDENIAGFVVGTDAFATSGAIYSQPTGTPNFSAGDLKSAFAVGSDQDVDGSIGSLDGIFTFDGAGNYSAVVDIANPSSAPAPGETATGTFSVNPDGSGTLTFGGSGATWMILTNGTQIFAIDKTGTAGAHIDPLLYVFTIERQPN